MTARRRPFLTARWTNLALVTYAVPPDALRAHVPPGCELDTIGGDAFVSLVAFDFTDCRVLGVPWPGFTCFPEVNLRYYVRRGDERGVAFVGELVPQRWVCAMARLFYNEPYAPARMTSRVTTTPSAVEVAHAVTRGGRTSRLRVMGDATRVTPATASIEHHFKEHRWGFGTSRADTLVRYEVDHPTWETYANPRVVALDWDWAATYGPAWAFLRDRLPYSVILAAGSEVAVYPRTLHAP